jgi:hypothetical protein
MLGQITWDQIHTSENIAQVIAQVLQDFELTVKSIKAIVSDSASNCVNAVEVQFRIKHVR